jgi:hypothetical protein
VRSFSAVPEKLAELISELDGKRAMELGGPTDTTNAPVDWEL